MILRDYRRLGIEPMRTPDGMLVSPELARKLGAIPHKLESDQ